MDRKTISKQLEEKRYSEDFIPVLEKYVQQQVDTNTYDLETNLALLKLYQFFPEKIQKNFLINVLAKGLMQLPNNDFLLCLYLIPESLQEEDPIKQIIHLYNLLQQAQFASFWNEVKNHRSVLDKVLGFDDSVRQFIIELIALTYRAISKESLKELLGLQEKDLEPLIKSKNWNQTSDSVVLQKEEAKFTKNRENVKLQDLSRMLANIH